MGSTACNRTQKEFKTLMIVSNLGFALMCNKKFSNLIWKLEKSLFSSPDPKAPKARTTPLELIYPLGSELIKECQSSDHQRDSSN